MTPTQTTVKPKPKKKRVTRQTVKKTKRHGKNLERDLVNDLIKEMRKAHADLFFFVDTDSMARQFKSGFDFLVAYGGNVLFVEAKRDKVATAKPDTAKQVTKKLSSFQQLTRAQVERSGTDFFVVVFKVVGEKVSVFTYGEGSSFVNATIEETAEYLVEYLNR